jgi:hypothetical protein
VESIFGPLQFHFEQVLLYNYNFACSSVWVWNFPDIRGGTQIQSVQEQSAEDNIWTEEGQSDRRVEKTA